MSRSVIFKLAVEEEHLVFAEVYVPNVPDTDGEFMTTESVKSMAYQFMRDFNLKNIDVQHDNVLVDGACVVESFIARESDPEFIVGSWVVGVHVPDETTWQQIKRGELNGFSLEALVSRHPTQLTLEVPPVIRGTTNEVNGHSHEFFVTYDVVGNFVGGTTSHVDGHHHNIARGTLTEDSMLHHHTFSFVENLVG